MREITDLLDEMTVAIRTYLAERNITDPVLIGIHTGGVWVAEALATRLRWSDPLGKLDISFYRDDFSQIGMHPQVRPSELPLALENRHILLVDDVLFTGDRKSVV